MSMNDYMCNATIAQYNRQFQVTVFSRFCYVLLCNHEYIHCLNHRQAKDYITRHNETERQLKFERRQCRLLCWNFIVHDQLPSFHTEIISTQFLWGNVLLKGAFDKYNIYLFISNSIEDIELNQYQNFQLILPMRFYLMRYFVNSIIFRVSVSHRLSMCIYWNWLWIKENARNIHISSKVNQSGT